MSRSKLVSLHVTKPAGADLRTIFFFFFGSLPALVVAAWFSTS